MRNKRLSGLSDILDVCGCLFMIFWVGLFVTLIIMIIRWFYLNV